MKELLLPARIVIRQNLKTENFTSLFARIRQKIVPESVPFV